MVNVSLGGIGNLVAAARVWVILYLTWEVSGPIGFPRSTNERLWYSTLKISLYRNTSDGLFVTSLVTLLVLVVCSDRLSNASVRQLVHLDSCSNWLVPGIKFSLVRALYYSRHISVGRILWRRHHRIAVRLWIILLFVWSLSPQRALHLGLKYPWYSYLFWLSLGNSSTFIFDGLALIPLYMRSIPLQSWDRSMTL